MTLVELEANVVSASDELEKSRATAEKALDAFFQAVIAQLRISFRERITGWVIGQPDVTLRLPDIGVVKRALAAIDSDVTARVGAAIGDDSFWRHRAGNRSTANYASTEYRTSATQGPQAITKPLELYAKGVLEPLARAHGYKTSEQPILVWSLLETPLDEYADAFEEFVRRKQKHGIAVLARDRFRAKELWVNA